MLLLSMIAERELPPQELTVLAPPQSAAYYRSAKNYHSVKRPRLKQRQKRVAPGRACWWLDFVFATTFLSHGNQSPVAGKSFIPKAGRLIHHPFAPLSSPPYICFTWLLPPLARSTPPLPSDETAWPDD